jgi:hypothetical protein
MRAVVIVRARRPRGVSKGNDRKARDRQFRVRLTAHNNLRGASRATFRRRASVAASAAEAAGLRTAPASGSLWS